MLAKCKDVGRLVNKLFANFLCKERIQNFFQGGGRGLHFEIFFGRITLRQIEEKNGCRGVWGMQQQKFFENLGPVIAILVLFVQFLRKILIKFITSNFESFTQI